MAAKDVGVKKGIYTPLKYGQACSGFCITTSFDKKFTSPYFDMGFSNMKDGDISDTEVSCRTLGCNPDFYCFKKTQLMFKIGTENKRQFFRKEDNPRLVCKKFPFIILSYPERELGDAKKNISRPDWENFKYSKFRAGPRHWCGHRVSASHHGRSKKGLQFSSYKHIEDYQEIACKPKDSWIIEYFDREAEDFFTVKFFDKRLKISMHESGFYAYSSPYRHNEKRSWKRTKKAKQWV